MKKSMCLFFSLIKHVYPFFADRLGNEEEDKVSVLSDFESIITKFSRVTGHTYDKSWVLLLEPLIALRLPKTKLFSFLSAIYKSYIPK